LHKQKELLVLEKVTSRVTKENTNTMHEKQSYSRQMRNNEYRIGRTADEFVILPELPVSH